MTISLLPSFSGITYPVKKMPEWDTDFQRSISGKVTTLARYSYPIYHFELPISFLRTAAAYKEFQDLMAFYNSVNGRANLFRFADPDDGTATAQSFGTGDGTTTTFQLVRAISGLSFSWVDPVYYPVTAAIYKNAVLQTLGVDYTLSTTGLVTFTVAPAAAAALTWTGTFNWLCRFDDDSQSFEQFVSDIFELKALRFSTEKI